MLDIKDLITLNDGKKYLVIAKLLHDNITYYYIVELDNIANVKICGEGSKNGKITLTEVEDPKIFKKLVLLFGKSINSKN